jgi:hypothetical protein
MTHDVTLDKGLGATALLSLAEKYHAFSGGSLTNFTLPTTGAAYAPYGDESVEVVTEPAAAIMINQFLGSAPNTALTPPLNQYGEPEDTSVPSTTAPPVTSTPTTGSSHTTTTAKPSEATSSTPAYDPRPC